MMGTRVVSDKFDRQDMSDEDDQLEPTQRRQLHNPSESKSSEQVEKFAGLGIGLSSLFAEYVVSHPCIVLRRQCQVFHNGERFHLTPFSLIPVLYNQISTQGFATLWKGIGSTFAARGILLIGETVVSEVTPLPKEVTRHASMKKYCEHLLLKGLGFLVTTPFYASSFVETVQSDIASERPGVFDCVKEGLQRVILWGQPQSTRVLTMWHILLPTVMYRLSHYLITSVAQYSVTSTFHIEEQEKRSSHEHNVDAPSAAKTMYEAYFPQLLASFTGSLIADIVLFPIETIINRLYLQGTRTIIDNVDTGLGVLPINTRYEGAFDCVTSMVREEGLAGFYRGFGALVMQYALHAAILRTAKLLFEQILKSETPQHQSHHRRSEHRERRERRDWRD